MVVRIVVGMSGGVDSSVAALLLKRQGHEVIGVFMNNWEEEDDSGVCTSQSDWADVRRVCDKIDIPYYSVNFARQYRERVFDHFLEEYRRGRTPNPDVLCNREIKFSAFLDFAEQLGADRLATGHFARIGRLGEEYTLLRAEDENKDQTYFLYMISQRALSKAMFPVGGLLKSQVRQIAREAGLATSEKKDSTGVCFIGERNFKKFLSGYLPARPGDIVLPDGTVIGRHDGLMYYTLGQRRGLGIGGGGDGRRWFVVEKDLEKNRLVVEQGEDSPRLYSREAVGSQAHWLAGHPPVEEGKPLEVLVRLRHRQPLQRAWIALAGDRAHMEFEAPQRAVTPGQAAVFYQGERCLGGVSVDWADGGKNPPCCGKNVLQNFSK
ncbi:MAG TPA: tRNA 2-thiouridine(34) synthase MnmA [Candidatus Pullichristensenella excrementigallinarum]|uniref:tRNA-specific 2-thiouridylase MnmA n=1 Tax=Candidatus Pullichristensenella excrementigallinarum TaxID=2840907 RepID=A0A9D1ID58_9FIRM|nr:tRNA 2-thiouridine(34) synthase MnmA [Candidatus Pullichristensenella excrementigallinarum]